MPPYAYDENGRRVMAPSKGELREKAILDQAEQQLREVGADAMTVESIANAAGITRGALYFYFRSKNDVLAALVQRITVELSGAVATRDRAVPDAPRAALESAIDLTADLWSRHGAVMRAAVELAPTVPVIATLWNGLREDTITSVVGIVRNGGAAAGDDAADVPALVRALIGMTERAFFEAVVSGSDIAVTAATVRVIWLRSLALD